MPVADNNGVTIFWDETGTGDALLLIAGNATTRLVWQPILPELSQRFRVLTFDARGVGESSKPAGPYTIEDMAADAIAVLDCAGIDAAHVFGVSMGGLVAQELALSYPKRVRRLILGCTSASPIQNTLAKVTKPFSDLAAHLPSRVTERLIAHIGYGPATSEVTIEADRQLMRANPVTPEVRKAHNDAVWAYHSRSRLSSITAPTLVLEGQNDRIVGPRLGAELVRLIPNARQASIPNGGHMFFTEYPAETVKTVNEFLTEVDANPELTQA